MGLKCEKRYSPSYRGLPSADTGSGSRSSSSAVRTGGANGKYISSCVRQSTHTRQARQERPSSLQHRHASARARLTRVRRVPLGQDEALEGDRQHGLSAHPGVGDDADDVLRRYR